MALYLRDDISYVKLILLLFKGGTFVAKKHIQRISNLEQKSIDDYLKNNGYDFNKATKKKQITTKQMQILFPGGSTPTDLDCWDISLLSYILINLFDAKLELFEKDAINTLRKIRNELAHIASMAISKEEFMGEWVRITQVLYRLTKRLTIADQDLIDGTIDTILTIKEFHVATNLLMPFKGPDEFVHEVIMEKWKTFEQKMIARICELEAKLKGNYTELNARVTVLENGELHDRAQAKLLNTLQQSVSREHNPTDEQSSDDEVQTACNNLVADMRDQGVDIVRIAEGSILMTFMCPTISVLKNISIYFANRMYEKRLIEVENALSNYLESPVKLDMSIELETLYSALLQIEEDVENKRSVVLTLECKSLEGVKKATDIFRNRSSSKALINVSEALSRYVGDQIVLHSNIDGYQLQDQTTELKQQLTLVDQNNQITRLPRYIDSMSQCIPVVAAAMKPRLHVAAIDFGTTYSGYAMSFRAEFESYPLKIQANNNWHSDNGGLHSLKTPSCILFRPDQSFHSFGYEAEDKYANLAMEEQHQDWFYYKRFKMLLYENKELNRGTTIMDEKGHVMPAMKVFSESIRFLKNHLIRSCEERDYGLHEHETHWVITVPAIWDDTAKQFMREAAIIAGIETTHLSLALEPEAASMFCRYLPVDRLMGGSGQRISCFDPGNKYLVLDAGGGTVDVTIHETQDDGTVRELYNANGGPWGGTTIDKTFLAFLAYIVGDEVMEDFQRKHIDDFLDLMRDFEVKKKTISPILDHKVTFEIPISLLESINAKGEDFRSSVMSKKDLQDKVSFARNNKLCIQPEQLKAFFTETCDNIVSHLKDIFNTAGVRGTDTILMVGGFSESMVLQDAVKRAFPDKKIITSQEAGLAVLKGAVIFGHCPTAIASRVTRYTYGVQIVKKFDPRQHPLDKMITIDDTEYCDHCFDKHLEEGQEVDVGLTVGEKRYIPTWQSQTSRVSVQVMTSTKKNPCYTDEPDCRVLGSIVVDVSGIDLYEKRVFNFKMIYGNTELGVEATVCETGQVLQASFDLLG